MPRRAAVVALAVLLSGIAGAAAARGEGSLSIGLADPPADAGDPRAAHYIVDRIEAGDQIVRRVRVGNESPDDLVVSVYDGAASAPNGEFRWSDGRGENDLTRWTAVQPAELTLAARSASEATVTIRVPEDAPLGEHYGVVWAELPRSNSGVVNRVGVRIYLTVTEPSDSKPSLMLVLVALVLVAAVSVIALGARRRGTGRGGSTAASP